MERLKTLLEDYNKKNISRYNNNKWAIQYCNGNFPLYWECVFNIAKSIPRSLKVLEIGSGFGFITSIFLYLNYIDIIGYELDCKIADIGNIFLKEKFGFDNIIRSEKFSYQNHYADILVLVNCVYVDYCESKEEYKKHLVDYYIRAGYPKYYILEVIDSEYTQKDNVFPYYVRLNTSDVKEMFPNSIIQYWSTYKYPKQKKSKTLYLIESK